MHQAATEQNEVIRRAGSYNPSIVFPSLGPGFLITIKSGMAKCHTAFPYKTLPFSGVF